MEGISTKDLWSKELLTPWGHNCEYTSAMGFCSHRSQPFISQKNQQIRDRKKLTGNGHNGKFTEEEQLQPVEEGTWGEESPSSDHAHLHGIWFSLRPPAYVGKYFENLVCLLLHVPLELDKILIGHFDQCLDKG